MIAVISAPRIACSEVISSWAGRSTASRTRSAFASTRRILRTTRAFCRPATAVRRSPTRSSSTSAISSNGRRSSRSRRARLRPSASAHRARSDGPPGSRRTGQVLILIAATHAFIRRSACIGGRIERTDLIMADISLEAVTGKLNRIGYETFIQALRQAKGAGNRNLELAHWMSHILQHNGTDVTRTVEHFNLDRAKMLMDIGEAIGGLRQGQTEMPEISDHVQEALDSGWYYATLLFGETQIRTGHILVGAFKKVETRRALTNLSRE